MKDANDLLKEWKDRLGLHDWQISLHTDCRPDEMTDPDAVGCSVWQEATKAARIEIIGEQYYGEYMVVRFDFEKTLVHELLHLKTCLISADCDPLQERIAHQLIDDLARAFVDAKRCKNDLCSNLRTG